MLNSRLHTRCLDQYYRARQAFDVAELACRNGWPRASLPMLHAATRLGLQALAGYYSRRKTKGLSLQSLVALAEPFCSIGHDAFQGFPAEKLHLLDAFDAVDKAYREGDYYQLTEEDIGQLVACVRTLLENVAFLFELP